MGDHERPIVGVDFDNTIVSYDDLLYEIATTRGLVESGAYGGKKGLRDAIRKLSEGEVLWQKIQAEIYGPRMSEAKLMEGVGSFFLECRNRSVKVYIVSHKTEFAGFDTTKTNLRSAAFRWLESHRFFDDSHFQISRDSVFFESTRKGKIERIKNLGCTHFIDDLEETFLEDIFPSDVLRILLDLYGSYNPRPGIVICSSWLDVTSRVFGGARRD